MPISALEPCVGLCVWPVDTVERLCDGVRRCRRLLPRVKRHHLSDERRGRSPIHSAARSDDTAQRPRHQEPLRDPLRPREHQPLHAGPYTPLSLWWSCELELYCIYVVLSLFRLQVFVLCLWAADYPMFKHPSNYPHLSRPWLNYQPVSSLRLRPMLYLSYFWVILSYVNHF